MVDDEDTLGRAVASDLLAERRRSSGDASRPPDDPASCAWFETALRSIRDGRCHAYCAAPGMPSAVLWSAWEALGPPPPPDDSTAEESADPESAGEKWRALLESSSLASCVRCVRAYRAQVDRWDAAAETAQTEEEEDAAVLAALLRERDDARLQSQARRLVARWPKESDASSPTPARLDATIHEAFAFPGAMESTTAGSLRETVADLVVAAGAAEIAAALETFGGGANEAEAEDGNLEDPDDVAPGLSLGDAPGAFEFLAHPRRKDVRRTMEACFRLLSSARTSKRAKKKEDVAFARPTRAASAPVAAIVAGWAETVWTAFEASQSQRNDDDDETPRGDETRAGRETNDAPTAFKGIAWRALAVALRSFRAAPRCRVLDAHPELVDAALDELSVSTTRRAVSEEVSEEMNGSTVSVTADAARVIAELVSADAGTYWADERSAPITAACDVLESAARSAPERNAHEACVAAVAAALFSASFAENDELKATNATNATQAHSEASRRTLAEGSRRAAEFLCAAVPGAPHLFDERVAWRARRAALDVVRAGYQAGRPLCASSVRDLWLRTLGEAGKRPPPTHAHRDSADDRAAARISAAAATASALRADAAALAALEHVHARGAGDFSDAPGFFPDVDDFLASFSSLDASFSSRDDEKDASLADTYFWEDDEDASALRGVSLEARFRRARRRRSPRAPRRRRVARGAARRRRARKHSPSRTLPGYFRVRPRTPLPRRA